MVHINALRAILKHNLKNRISKAKRIPRHNKKDYIKQADDIISSLTEKELKEKGICNKVFESLTNSILKGLSNGILTGYGKDDEDKKRKNEEKEKEENLRDKNV